MLFLGCKLPFNHTAMNLIFAHFRDFPHQRASAPMSGSKSETAKPET
jgi:hypothetical protein